MAPRLATPSARRGLRPPRFFPRLGQGDTSGQGAYIGSGARSRQKWQNHPSRTRTTTRTRTIGGAHAPLMIPKLAESVGPVAILDPLAGPIAHLLAQV